VGEGSASRPGCSLPPGKTQYPLYRRLGGPQGRSGQVRKISPPPPNWDSIPGPSSPQPVAIRTELPGPHSSKWVSEKNEEFLYRLNPLNYLAAPDSGLDFHDLFPVGGLLKLSMFRNTTYPSSNLIRNIKKRQSYNFEVSHPRCIDLII
jgi:hypothetical protein